MKHTKKLLMLTVLLLVSVLLAAVPAYARSKPAAKIGRKSYSSFAKAVKAVEKGQTIKLQKDVKLKKNKNIMFADKKPAFTIDLNKHTLSIKGGGWIFNAMKKADITFKNGTIKGGIELRNGGSLKFINVKLKGYITGHAIDVSITDSEMSNGKGFAVGTFVTEKKHVNTLNITDSTLKSGIMAYGTDITIKNSDITASEPLRLVNGILDFKSGNVTATGDSHAAISADGTKITIKKGDIKSMYDNCISLAENTSLTIEEGTFVGEEYCIYIYSYYGKAKVSISDGKFHSIKRSAVHNYGGKVNITGGLFDAQESHAITNSGGVMSIKNAVVTAVHEGSDGVLSTGPDAKLTIGSGCNIFSNSGHAVSVSDKSNATVDESGLSTGSDQYYAYGYPDHIYLKQNY